MRLRSSRMAAEAKGPRSTASSRTGGCVSAARTGQRAHRPSGATAELSDKQRGEDERDRRQELDQHVERRTGRVLERVANGVADDRCRVGIGLLADDVAVGVLEVARLDVLLRVVPRAAAVVQNGGEQDTG